ncbi:MAG: hypothetical protein ACI9EF_002893 [Pseudohongiellaceae bacterium]|jgi:hypothetical protein
MVDVVRLWWPLAASWLLMAVELPLLTAVVGRLPDERIHLAAYGSIVFPLSLVIEGPIIMLLAASTALCSDWDSYRKVRRFMIASSGVLTLVHIAVAFTPLYDMVAGLIVASKGADDQAAADVVAAGRIGLQIMTPWTAAIAYRRFQQGVLIRNEHGRAVTAGTAVRLCANVSVLCFGAYIMHWSGIVVGATAIAMGVTAEALWIGRRVQPVLAEKVRPAPKAAETLTLRSFLHFYAPLAMTPLITLCIPLIGASAMARMPNAIASLAAWPAVHGMLFVTRSLGMAYNEVVVTLVDRPGAVEVLSRFQRRLALGTMSFLAILAATPLAGWWFEGLSDLDPEVARLCRICMGLGILMPGYAVMQSWYQGVLVRSRSTRAITEAVALYFVVSASLLQLGVSRGDVPGVLWSLSSFVIAGVSQTIWLRWRSRGAVAAFSDPK